MEILKYVIADDKIAELLGVQNFSNKESAVLELVKNAYDAGAMELNIEFSNDKITIQDDGCGMNFDEVKNQWTRIGESKKNYEFYDNENNKRVYSGSKGIGRFALARLGSKINVYSKKKGDPAIVWYTDWSTTSLNTSNYDNVGTKIEIIGLRDKWTETTIKNLVEYISTTYNDDRMKINILHKNNIYNVEKKFNNPVLGKNFVAKIKLQYISTLKKIKCTIENDEFLDESKEYCKDISLNYYEEEMPIENNKEINIDGDLDEILVNLGDFSAEFYYGFKPNKIEVEKFLYKHISLPELYKEGIILYRNAFSISSYDGKKDWLELDKRVRKSPAAASHPTGAWRVRSNQISGKVVIDKQRNKYLEDLSNRQGIAENDYYKVFIDIIEEGISIFERYRQNIIRKINIKNKEEAPKKNKVVDDFIKKPMDVKQYPDSQINQLALEIIDLKNDIVNNKNESIDKEKRYKYDTRILNSLSTIGLKASSIAHDVHTYRDNLNYANDNLVNRLKELGVWKIIDADENKRHTFENVPLMLERNKKILDKVKAFIDVMLENIEKNKFIPSIYCINDILSGIKTNWERDYEWININYNVDPDLNFYTAIDIFNVIFDNLILNSVQQNNKTSELNIEITCEKDDDFLYINYKDDGVGLSKKYLRNPKLILEVHESSRKDGHGLGMWIINNTLNMTGGDVLNINGENGFSINFKVGNKI